MGACWHTCKLADSLADTCPLPTEGRGEPRVPSPDAQEAGLSPHWLEAGWGNSWRGSHCQG